METHIKKYLLHLTFERNFSENTVKAYEIDLVQFNGFLNEQFGTDRVRPRMRRALAPLEAIPVVTKPRRFTWGTCHHAIGSGSFFSTSRKRRFCPSFAYGAKCR